MKNINQNKKSNTLYTQIFNKFLKNFLYITKKKYFIMYLKHIYNNKNNLLLKL